MKPTQRRRSSVSIRSTHRKFAWVGLVSRLLPAFVLAIGLAVWMSANRSAEAQYPNNFGANQNFGTVPPTQPLNQLDPGAQNYSATPNQPMFRTANAAGNVPGGQTAGSSIPAFDPATATGNIGTEQGDTEPDSESSSFQMPALVQKVMSGGWLMLPLAICSLVVIALSMERMVALRRGRVIPRPFVRRFTECVEDGVLSYEEATELCKEFDCPVSEVFRAALRRWGRPMFEIEQAVMDAGDRVSDGLKRFLRVFHAISNVAPLIGLLGTVIGMIKAFEVISDQQSLGRPELLASGISMALMTTAGGLAVAIPAYLAYMYFSSKSDRYLGEIEKLCQRVIDCISAESLEDSGNRSKKRKAA